MHDFKLSNFLISQQQLAKKKCGGLRLVLSVPQIKSRSSQNDNELVEPF